MRNKLIFSFILWGTLNAIINYPIFPTLYYLSNENFIFASFLSTIINISSSFFIQKYLTFKKRGNIIREYILYWVNSILAIIVSIGILYFLVKIAQLNAYLSQGIVTIFGAIAVFFLHKNITFKKR